jgi:hypothetical protein
MYSRLFTLLMALVLASCGAGVKRIATVGRLPVTLAGSPSALGVEEESTEKDGDEAEESPGEWAEFHLLKRTGGAPLPVEKLLAAKRHKDTMLARAIGRSRSGAPRAVSAADGALGTWQGVGPGNIGGRTRAFVIRPDNPDIMYAGSEGGGVWKTNDRGASWNPLTDFLPSLAVASLAIDPNNPDTLYAGTGEWFTGSTRGDSIRGAGVFKTTDGGATWTQLAGTANSSFYYVNKLVISPNDSQHVYAATWNGIWYSPDAGRTWRNVVSRSGSNYGCQDLLIRSDQPTDYLFAACAYIAGVNPAIYRNVDAAGAGKWDIVFTTSQMARTTIAVAPSNQSIIYAAVTSSESGNYNNGLLGVWRSSSNGDPNTWTQQVSNKDPNLLNTVLFTNPRGAFNDVCSGTARTFGNQGDYDNVIAVDPVNPDVVWVGGIDLFRSDDAGRNWGIAAFWQAYNTPQGAHADNHAIVFSPGYDASSNQTLYATGDGGIFRTDNATAPVAIGDRAACSPYPTQVVWINMNNGYAVTQFYHGSVYPGAAAYLGGSQDNNMERGSDATGPNAWTIPNYIGDGGYSAIDPNDPNVWYILGTHLTIQKTTNGGATFSSVTRGITESTNNFQFIAPFVMDPSEPRRLYTGGLTLWRSVDGAGNWSEAGSPVTAGSGSITSIAVSASDPNHVAFGTSGGFVYVNGGALTTDKTSVWSSTQPRPGFVSNVAFDPGNPNTIYVTYSQYKQTTAQSHVYKSADGGATWTGTDGSGATGLPDIPVFSIIVDPQNTSNLYLGTDIGLFSSKDGGATWARDTNPFADSPTEALALDRSSGQSTLVAFTHGRGVWKTVLPGSGDPCQYSVSENSVEFSAYGSSKTLDLTTGDSCTWSVLQGDTLYTSDFVINASGAPAIGKGNGSFTVGARFINNTAKSFTTQVQVQNQAISVVQDAAQTAAGNDDSAAAFSFGTLPAVVIQKASDGTESDADPVHSCTNSADFKTLWYSVTAPADGHVTLSFLDTQNSVDAGAVIALYRLQDGAVGKEFVCSVVPQSTSSHVITLSAAVQAGETFLVEVSATTAGSTSGASLVPGNISLWATAGK